MKNYKNFVENWNLQIKIRTFIDKTRNSHNKQASLHDLFLVHIYI
jgi:hypothetical protein